MSQVFAHRTPERTGARAVYDADRRLVTQHGLVKKRFKAWQSLMDPQPQEIDLWQARCAALDCNTHLPLMFVGRGLADLCRRHFERQPAAAATCPTPMQGH